jgi:membrane protein implicated in regulation of membrane protease activity
MANWFSESNKTSRVVFILTIVYIVGVIAVLLLERGIIAVAALYHNPYLLIGFAIVSFAFSVFISAFHMSTIIKRRKRKTDMPFSKAS